MISIKNGHHFLLPSRKMIADGRDISGYRWSRLFSVRAAARMLVCLMRIYRARRFLEIFFCRHQHRRDDGIAPRRRR